MLKNRSGFLSISWKFKLKFRFGTDGKYHLVRFGFSIPPRKILGLARKMDSMKEESNNSEKYLDSQLWHACAGGMVEIPPVNSKVFYFPQGHAEMAEGQLDFRTHKIPPLVLTRVSAIRFMADSQTDEVFAEICLHPLSSNDFESGADDWVGGNNQSESEEKHTSFAKTLTQSDANNGGGFSVPRYCAETIFPPLNYSANPPVQTINVKDVHGQIWKFRHIYRGTPRRHLLTTGWSNFVNYKKLVAGDSIVFLKAENGELRIGIRRAKRGIGGQFDCSSGCSRGTVSADSIIESAILASRGHAFVVKYFPRSNTPPFFVGACAVRAAMRVRWSAGMRFKMAFETEDSSRISWFMGTISSIQVSDPIRWPDSPWRLLQVTWDEPDLLQNVKFVNPWSIEMVTNMLPYHISPFGSLAKKPKLLSSPTMSPEFVKPMSDFPGMLDVTLAGIQGARHAQSTLSSLNLSKFQATNLPMIAKNNSTGSGRKSEWQNSEKPSKILKEKEPKTPHILLFGQVILLDQTVSKDSTIETVGKSLSEKTDTSDGVGTSPPWNSSPENLSDAGSPWCKDHQKTVVDLKTGHCNEFGDQIFLAGDHFSIP